MSPILVRPVREQFEHDRVIRVLQARYKRKYEVAINPGAEQNASVGVGDIPMYPDLVLFSQERSRKLQATVEVETTESINTLEAMAEWGPFSRLRAAFFLYVPPNAIDTVRRLCAEHHVEPAEIWTYHTAVDQVRFTMVHQSAAAAKARAADRPEKDDAVETADKLRRPEHAANADKPAIPEPPRVGKKPAAASNAGATRKPATAKASKRFKTARTSKTSKSVKTSKPAKASKGSRNSVPSRGAKTATRTRGATSATKAPARQSAKARRR